MEHRGRERIGVAEEHAVSKRREKVLVPAVDTCDVGELPALPRSAALPADLRVHASVLWIPERLVPLRERFGERRLASGLGSEEADPGHGGGLVVHQPRVPYRAPSSIHGSDGPPQAEPGDLRG